MILLETITLCVIGSTVRDIVLARDVHKRRGIVVKELHRVIPTNNAHSIRRSHTGIGAELLEHGLESLTVIEDLGECDLAAAFFPAKFGALLKARGSFESKTLDGLPPKAL